MFALTVFWIANSTVTQQRANAVDSPTVDSGNFGLEIHSGIRPRMLGNRSESPSNHIIAKFAKASTTDVLLPRFPGLGSGIGPRSLLA